MARAILYGGPEGEEEEGEEEECGEIGGERRRRLAEELRRAAQVLQPGVISHGGVGKRLIRKRIFFFLFWLDCFFLLTNRFFLWFGRKRSTERDREMVSVGERSVYPKGES